MQGTILKYDNTTHTGFISGHDGKRYQFTKVDWTEKEEPQENQTVDFEIDEGNKKKAKDIVLLKTAVTEQKKNTSLPKVAFGSGVLCLIYGVGAKEEAFVNGDPDMVFTWLFSIPFLVGIASFFVKMERRYLILIAIVMGMVGLLVAGTETDVFSDNVKDF